MAPFFCQTQSCVVVAILDVDVCSVFDEETHYFYMPESGGKHQGSCADIRLGIDWGSVFYSRRVISRSPAAAAYIKAVSPWSSRPSALYSHIQCSNKRRTTSAWP